MSYLLKLSCIYYKFHLFLPSKMNVSGSLFLPSEMNVSVPPTWHDMFVSHCTACSSYQILPTGCKFFRKIAYSTFKRKQCFVCLKVFCGCHSEYWLANLISVMCQVHEINLLLGEMEVFEVI